MYVGCYVCNLDFSGQARCGFSPPLRCKLFSLFRAAVARRTCTVVNREGKPTLSRQPETKWLVSERSEGAIIISVFATGVCLVLSHAKGQLGLQDGYRGEGELWKRAVVGPQ